MASLVMGVARSTCAEVAEQLEHVLALVDDELHNKGGIGNEWEAANQLRSAVRYLGSVVIHLTRAEDAKRKVEERTHTRKCDECHRIFDMSSERDADEWAHGHDCEVGV